MPCPGPALSCLALPRALKGVGLGGLGCGVGEKEGKTFYGQAFRLIAIVQRVRHKTTYRLHSSSFLGLPYRILDTNPKKELLRSLWVSPTHYFTGNLKAKLQNLQPKSQQPQPQTLSPKPANQQILTRNRKP